MERPAKIDEIVVKLQSLVVEKGTDKSKPWKTVTTAELRELIQYLEKLERGY